MEHKKAHEPLLRMAKRGTALPGWKAWGIRLIGFLLSLVACALLIAAKNGLDIFRAAAAARIPFERVVKWIWPLIGTILVVLLLTTYVPQLSLLLV